MRRDVLLAAGFATAVLVGTWRAGVVQDPPRALDLIAYLLAMAAAAAVAWRRSAPAVALGVTVALASAYLLAGYPFGPVLLAVVWAMFEYARRRPLRKSAPAGLVAAAVSVIAVLPRLAGQLDLLALGLVLWAACWLAVPWSLGALTYVRGRALVREREDLVTRAVLQERIRVSREVHDVAGHGFAVVAMQAGVALVVLDDQPRQARAALEAIRETSKAALTELRGVLDTIAPPPAGTTADPPGGISGLVERARAGGLPVRLECADLAAVAPDRQQLVYGIVRESLTNVLRHAGAAPTIVAVSRAGDELAVQVVDDGPPVGAWTEGRGIGGMRTRVEAAGGSLTVGRRADGFTVDARIPA